MTNFFEHRIDEITKRLWVFFVFIVNDRWFAIIRGLLGCKHLPSNEAERVNVRFEIIVELVAASSRRATFRGKIGKSSSDSCVDIMEI